MSALTDLFTALANKIRSKTGTATTYTPLEMVSDGIDDVYDAGYAAGGGGATGIPITPSNASPVTLTNGESYSMLANGFAVSSYTSINPSDSTPVPLSAQTIYKAGGAGYAIASNPTTLTPNNTSPPSIASGTIYKGGGTGKAIASIATNGNGVTPSSSGQYFYSGWNRMTSAGYAYSSQPSSGYTNGWNSETTLWTNSSPTSSFGAQNVTLSQSIQNFNFIKIICRASTSVSTTSEAIYSKSFVLSCVSGNAAPRMALSTRTGSQSYVRIINYTSDTQIYFDTAHKRATSGDTNGYVIPTSIVGLK